jgi:hypothetical protein
MLYFGDLASGNPRLGQMLRSLAILHFRMIVGGRFGIGRTHTRRRIGSSALGPLYECVAAGRRPESMIYLESEAVILDDGW